MKFQRPLFLFLLILYASLAVSQDTIVLKNNSQVIGAITKIYSQRIEYVNFGDTTGRQYFSYPIKELLFIRYAGGRIDTFGKVTQLMLEDDTGIDPRKAYLQGFKDGRKYYKPTRERVSGLSVLVWPFTSTVVCIYYLFSKVDFGDMMEVEYFRNNTSQHYRNGFRKGASQRRRIAAWSTYGAGAMVYVGAGALLNVNLLKLGF